MCYEGFIILHLHLKSLYMWTVWMVMAAYLHVLGMALLNKFALNLVSLVNTTICWLHWRSLELSCCRPKLYLIYFTKNRYNETRLTIGYIELMTRIWSQIIVEFLVAEVAPGHVSANTSASSANFYSTKCSICINRLATNAMIQYGHWHNLEITCFTSLELRMRKQEGHSENYIVKVNLSLYRPWRTLGLREVEAPTFSDIRLTDGGKVVSPMYWPLLTPRKIPGTHFC
jgi:hypothetical protein